MTLSVDEHGRTVILPLPGADRLPRSLVYRGQVFAPKAELHLTFAGSGAKHPAEALRAAARGAAPAVYPLGEYRLVRKDERRSIIELARVDGLEEFYARLEAALGAPHGGLIRPPAHVTLFTSCDPAGRGIGIATQDELAAWTEPLPPLAASPWKLGQDGAILGP